MLKWFKRKPLVEIGQKYIRKTDSNWQLPCSTADIVVITNITKDHKRLKYKYIVLNGVERKNLSENLSSFPTVYFLRHWELVK